ncbi:MAG: NAD(P)-dependent oxidoreductase [Blautia sp.]|nr:NAD(P)-dependent oxidoreductase [Lachnoclostridium sp.]MCM1212183.1 NAD(P)-dependent oxidoreductase [Blautia sp.]
MRAVVTGATGFVGKWLVNELLSQGDEVTVIVRNRQMIPVEWLDKLCIIERTMEQLADIQKEDFGNRTQDIFFHLAWAGTSGMDRADIGLQLGNVQFTCEAVCLAERVGCSKFINAGSIMEYEAMQYLSSDGAVPGLGNIYSTAKLTADFMAKIVAAKANIAYVNVIISNIYGPGERSARFLNTVLRKMLGNEKIALTHGNQLYDFIYVSDAVRAMITAGKKGKANTAYYIGNVRQRPLKEYVICMKSILNSDSELGFGEIPFQGALLTYHEFDTGRLEQLGFWPAVTFEEGVKLTRDWILGGENEYKFSDI